MRDARDPRSDLRARLRALRDTFSGGIRSVSATPLNRPIGPHRRFDWLQMDLSEVKTVKNALGGTLNDVVLATVTGAVRRFLERRRVNVDTLDFRVMAPVSVRSRGRARHARQSRLGVDGAAAARRTRSAQRAGARSARPRAR